MTVVGRSAYWARNLESALLERLIAARGAELGEGVVFVGRPIVEISPGSRIEIGSRTRLVSHSRYTALGVARPMILRTLSASAAITIGANVRMSGVTLCSVNAIEIGDDTLLGADVLVADTDFHNVDSYDRMLPAPSTRDAVRIGERVFIGARSIVLKGIDIGDSTVIGAGSVVTKSLPSGVIAAGNPCRILREL